MVCTLEEVGTTRTVVRFQANHEKFRWNSFKLECLFCFAHKLLNFCKCACHIFTFTISIVCGMRNCYFPYLIHFLSEIFYWRCQSLSSCVQVLINLLFQRSLERDLSTYVVATLSSLSIKLIFLVRNCLSKYLSPIWEVFCHATKRGKWGLRVVPDVCLGATMLKSIGLLFLEWLEIIRIFYPMEETCRIVAKAPFLRNENYRQHFQIGRHVINDFFIFPGRCENGNPCAQNCYNIHNEMYECDCNQGFVLSDNGYSCIGKFFFNVIFKYLTVFIRSVFLKCFLTTAYTFSITKYATKTFPYCYERLVVLSQKLVGPKVIIWNS